MLTSPTGKQNKRSKFNTPSLFLVLCIVELQRRWNENRPEWKFCFIAVLAACLSRFSFSFCFIKRKEEEEGSMFPIRSVGFLLEPHIPTLPPTFNPKPPTQYSHTHTHPVTDWYGFQLDWSLCRDTHWPQPIQSIPDLQRCTGEGVFLHEYRACSRTKTSTWRWRQTLWTCSQKTHLHMRRWSLFYSDEWLNEHPGVCWCECLKGRVTQ